jgi:ribonuclease HII
MFTCFVKGDSLHKCISAASILAKTFHDDFIENISKDDSLLDERYHILSNMGYGTKTHIDGIKEYGHTMYHRQSFIKKYSVH